MSIELKPCPFCGGEAELVVEHDHSWIRHNGCPADIGGFECDHEAVRAWNTRAALSPIPDPAGGMPVEVECTRCHGQTVEPDFNGYCPVCHDDMGGAHER